MRPARVQEAPFSLETVHRFATLGQLLLAGSTLLGVWQPDHGQRIKNVYFTLVLGMLAVMSAETPRKKIAAVALSVMTLGMMGLNEMGLGFESLRSARAGEGSGHSLEL